MNKFRVALAPNASQSMPAYDMRTSDDAARLRRGGGMKINALRNAEMRRAAMHRVLAVVCAMLAMLAVQAYRGQGTGAMALAATTTHEEADPVDGQASLAPMPLNNQAIAGRVPPITMSAAKPSHRPRRPAGDRRWPRLRRDCIGMATMRRRARMKRPCPVPALRRGRCRVWPMRWIGNARCHA
jgi:hypothetical protein